MSFEACFWVELFSLPLPRFFVPFGVWLCFVAVFWLGVSGFLGFPVGVSSFMCGFYLFCGFGGHGAGVYT